VAVVRAHDHVVFANVSQEIGQVFVGGMTTDSALMFNFESLGCDLIFINRISNGVRESDPELQFDERNDTVFRRSLNATPSNELNTVWRPSRLKPTFSWSEKAINGRNLTVPISSVRRKR